MLIIFYLMEYNVTWDIVFKYARKQRKRLFKIIRNNEEFKAHNT